ncbi:unnamed protein product [Caenorhabditis brenneri]
MSENGEDETFNFDLFSEFMDAAEEEKKPVLKRKATEKEINQLCTFIGGFEKWSLLIEDCRREIIKYLDYKSTCRLSFCSKMDYESVNNVPIHIHSIRISENFDEYYYYNSEPFDNVAVIVQFDDQHNSKNRFEVVFSQLEEDTVLQWLKYEQNKRPEKKSVTLKLSNYREEAVMFAEKWMAKCSYEIKGFSVNFKQYPFETSKIKSLPDCRSVHISADSEDEFCWWIQKVPEDLLDLELSTNDTFSYPSEILSCPQVMNTARLSTWDKMGFTDDQFLKLKTKSVMFSYFNITEDGINQFLKNWVNGKGVEGFKKALLWSEQTRDELKILRGIEVRPWDEEFRNEALGFCEDYERICGSGSTYQIKSRIDPFESLTLCMRDDRVSIDATGTKMTWNGETYTSYGIP